MKYDIEDVNLSNIIKPKRIKTINGMLEYADFGDGPVIVALHGAMGGYDQSVILAQVIGCSGYRYISMSRPGYLGTPISSGRTPEEQGDLIAILLDNLNVQRAGVMAISGGGPAAIQFGLRHSHRCKGLVLVSTYAEKIDVPVPFSFKIMEFLAGYSWFADFMGNRAENGLEAIAKRSIRDSEILSNTLKDPDIWPLFSTMLLSTYNQMGNRVEGTDNDIEITRTSSYPLEKLNLPVLIVHGTEDPLINFEVHTKIFMDRLPDAELVAIDGGEHISIFTHRNQVRNKVFEFMKSNF